ncbi:hypothetical protein B0H16DRAFT_1469102 [Mycena metata]|uniref:Uncharacterized protein n=1 Tax=Mycena metata TaxID=1033252 RepID=A0AAD7MT46_9AGAR|nr:hypothetical protein B0H16DRAFT_1469102 [Mycena metata]
MAHSDFPVSGVGVETVRKKSESWPIYGVLGHAITNIDVLCPKFAVELIGTDQPGILNIPEMPKDLDKPRNGTRSMGNSNQKINLPAAIVLRVAPKAKISPTKPLISIALRPIKELNQLTGGSSTVDGQAAVWPTKLRVGKHKGDAKACRGKDPQEIVLEMIVWIHVDYESN